MRRILFFLILSLLASGNVNAGCDDSLADGVDYTEEAEASIARLEENQLDQWPVCMAKTQSSLSDDPKKKNAPRGWRLQVRDVKVSNGAGFIVALTGKMMLMPGMPKEAAFNRIDIDSEGRISGLS